MRLASTTKARRLTTRGLALVATVTTIGLGVAAPGGAAASTGRTGSTHLAKVGTHYSTYHRLCSTPRPGHASCMAIRSLPATKSTPHARANYVRSAVGVGPAGGLTPDDFAAAYNFNPYGGTVTPQIVAIVDAYDDPNALSDLNFFDSYYGITPDGINATETAGSFIKVGQTGSTTNLPDADTTGWSGEESLDIDTVRAVCRNCTILFVEADSSRNSDLQKGVRAAAKLGATEISNSYGGAEPPGKKLSKKQIAKIAKPYNYPGVVVTASTGDDGWFSYGNVNDNRPSANAPNLPSSLPGVVAVGGTSLSLNSDGTRHAESVWNGNGYVDNHALSQQVNFGASGGGCSQIYKAPGWQANIAGFAKTGCGKYRLAADISADADPASGIDVYDTYNCGKACKSVVTHPWSTIGGTSLSSPLIAAMWALDGGSGGVAYPGLSLYGNAGSPALFDVKVGGNSWCDSDPKCSKHTSKEFKHVKNPNALFFGGKANKPVGVLDCAFARNTSKPTVIKNDHQCNAVKGFDGPSGVGVPNGLAAFTALAPTATIKHGAAAANANTTFSATVSDPFPGGKIASYAWNFGDGAKSHAVKPVHKYAADGTYNVSLTVKDNYGRLYVASTSVLVSG